MLTLLRHEEKTERLPDTPGVYFFIKRIKDGGLGMGGNTEDSDEQSSDLGPQASSRILYIGKATSLRDRVRSYFADNIREVRSPLIERMMEEATDIEFQETDSVLEALILESNLIKKHTPPYNTQSKDDKSYTFVGITNEEYPRIYTVRGRELQTHIDPDHFSHVFGPFPQGNDVKIALGIIRKIFPFLGKKDPLPHESRRKSRLNEDLGLAPVFGTEEGREEYGKVIDHIRLIFEGKKSTLIQQLKRDMKTRAEKLEFEKADTIKKQIFALEHISDIALIKSEATSDALGMRIESYDIDHMSGKNMVGVMVVLEDGYPKKSDYRKFKIKTVDGANDTGALKEVLRRRLMHDEWRLPCLIVVDGSTAQIRTAENVLEEFGYAIPVVSVVKDEHHRPKGIQGDEESKKKLEREILLANSEAHRFAVSYHTLMRGRGMRGKE